MKNAKTKAPTKFDIETARERAEQAERHRKRRALEQKLKDHYKAKAVYATDVKISIWFDGQVKGARFIPKLGESVLEIKGTPNI